MTDIVERLRERAVIARDEGNATATSDAYHFEEAAKEIERLRANIERLMAQVTDMASVADDLNEACMRKNADNARLRAALDEIDSHTYGTELHDTDEEGCRAGSRSRRFGMARGIGAASARLCFNHRQGKAR